MLENQPTTFIDLLNACIYQENTTKKILNDLITLLRLKAIHMKKQKHMNNIDETISSNKVLAEFYQKILNDEENNQENKNG